MARTTRKWVPIVAGIAILLVFAVVGAGVVAVSMFRDNVRMTRNVPSDAVVRAFDAQRARFPDPRPVLLIGDDRRPTYAPGHESRKNPGSVTELHVLAFDAGDQDLATVTVPMWLLRLKSGPIAFGEYASGFDDHGVTLTAEDVDKQGPGVIVEYETPAGSRFLLSAQ